MRSYEAESYEELVENIQDETLQRFMDDEAVFLEGVADAQDRTFVDLGAGYGRALPAIARVAHDVVAIEINPEMYKELERRASVQPQVTAIQGDFLKLGEILPEGVQNPAFLILQNSLGTIEGGDYKDVMRVVVDEAVKRHGHLILSLLRQPALKTWGVSMYGKLRKMVGAVDLNRSDFEEGLLVTDTGYTSKWWTDDDIANFRQLGEVVREQKADEYVLLEVAPSG